MKRLAAICIDRPVFATMIVLALAVSGGASYFRLGIDRFPRVDLPQIAVRTTLPSASVEETEVRISQPIEEAVNTVEGITELRSVTGAGTSNVFAVFDLDRDIDGFLDRERAAFEPLFQRSSFAVRHRDEELPVGGGLEPVHRADVLMSCCRSRPRLAGEPFDGKVILLALRQQELESDLAVGPDVMRTVDLPL